MAHYLPPDPYGVLDGTVFPMGLYPQMMQGHPEPPLVTYECHLTRNSQRIGLPTGVDHRGSSVSNSFQSSFSADTAAVGTMMETAATSDCESADGYPALQPRRRMRTFRLDETSTVRAFLSSRLKRMQQLVDKKIAKAWIKGICPKKQAKFPYQNKSRKQDDCHPQEVPGWWPSLSDCRFIEPDHIKRDERMKLCLHLLTLRPTPEQLREWNNGSTEPHPTHVAKGWTAFLEELAGPSIFDDLPKESEDRTRRRKDLMRQMYEVASLEEFYLAGNLVGKEKSVFHWPDDEDDRKVSVNLKRVRDASVESSEDLDSYDPDSFNTPGAFKRARTAASAGDFSSAHMYSGGHQGFQQFQDSSTRSMSYPSARAHFPQDETPTAACETGYAFSSQRNSDNQRRHSEPHNAEANAPSIKHEGKGHAIVKDPAMWRKQEQEAAAAAAAAVAAANNPNTVETWTMRSSLSPPLCHDSPQSHNGNTKSQDAVSMMSSPSHGLPTPAYQVPVWELHTIPQPNGIIDLPREVNFATGSMLHGDYALPHGSIGARPPTPPFSTPPEYAIAGDQFYSIPFESTNYPDGFRGASCGMNPHGAAPATMPSGYQIVTHEVPPPVRVEPCAYAPPVAQGPSWFNRGFTGHSSGVGGGQPT